MLLLLRQIKNINRNNIGYYLFTQFIVIMLFSVIYYYTNTLDNQHEKLFDTYLDCIYFTIVTHFTVGYGDISPKTKLHKILTMMQIIIAFLISDN